VTPDQIDDLPPEKKGSAHPNPLESFDPRYLALLLKGTREQIIIRAGTKSGNVVLTWGHLRTLHLRLNVLRRKQLLENPTFGKVLYRATNRLDRQLQALIIEPRDSLFDGVLGDLTGQSLTSEPIPESTPQEVRDELDALDQLGSKLADD
jgi:hypothetical protein